MKVRSVHKEFSDHNRALAAIKALDKAGFKSVEVDERSVIPDPVDVGQAPPRKKNRYLTTGIFSGLMLGLIVGIMVFWIPAEAMNMHDKTLLIVVGMIAMIVALVAAGVFEALVWSRRDSPVPPSSNHNYTIDVRVNTNDEKEMRLAERILTQRHDRSSYAF